jgi:3-phenylpropionate/trans-cinnamate dioxygenase ferredoxin reductase component
LVVVGSGPAGISAAESFRERDGDSPVLVLSSDPDLPYERPPLSKDFLRGETDDVSLHPPEWFTERAIDLRRRHTVQAIDVAERAVTVDGERVPYRALVLACGAAPSPATRTGR